EVRTQVVSGTHYAFEFELQDGELWNAMVLRSARGDYMIERHAKKG
ncbi:cystatin, partial [Vibrio parahaemolyticus]|nr:cystatin [Vibrio parahaemolyticus]